MSEDPLMVAMATVLLQGTVLYFHAILFFSVYKSAIVERLENAEKGEMEIMCVWARSCSLGGCQTL